MISLVHALEQALDAGNAAQSCLKALRDGPKTVLSESGRDIKLQADRDAEAAILDVLAPSGFPVLAEEGGATGDVESGGPVWVVDPLDGTMNFRHGIPFFSTSIALLVDGKPVLGVVRDITRDETFSGAVGEGCWCNGSAVNVSPESDPARAILATGLPTARDHSEASLARFVRDLARFKKVRMLGSAALMLAYVAAGRVQAYREDDIMLWDVAAGLALVSAAGGYVSSDPSTRHHWARHVRAAGSPALWESVDT